jgi:hypothetical protein
MQANRQTNGGMTTPGLIAVGVLLVGFGAFAMLTQLTDWVWPQSAWPFVIIVPGLGLFLAGIATRGEAGLGMTVGGSIVTTVGLILLFQSATDTFSSWAYAWALLPTAAGLGTIAHGVIHQEREAIRNGTNTALIGAGLFAVGLVFFEGIVGLDGRRSELFSGVVAPAVLIVVGAAVLLRALLGWPRNNAPDPE